MLLVETPCIYRPDSQMIRRLITESLEEGNGNLFLNDVLIITAEEKNGNNRYYPIELWKREIEAFQKKIEQGTTETVGELDHPDSTIINLKNGSHCFRQVWWEGKNVKANIEVFCAPEPSLKGNPSGRILGSYLANGLAVGFSTRGLGSLVKNGELMEVQDDFSFLTCDAVSNPSNFGSWSKINENRQSDINIDRYNKVNYILTEILCSKGTCPLW
jgi:hypothetical protein